MQLISASEFKSYLVDSNFQIIDVREPYEINLSSMKSLNIPMAEVINRISEIDKEKVICVVCKTGKRASAVANLLETEFNFKDILVLEGGLTEYSLIEPSFLID
jgi:rhodanese-related sulfurtransferase